MRTVFSSRLVAVAVSVLLILTGWTGLSGTARAAEAPVPIELGTPVTVELPESTSKAQYTFTTTGLAGGHARLAVLVDEITVPFGVYAVFTGSSSYSEMASGTTYFEVPIRADGTWTVAVSAVKLHSGHTPGTGTARLTVELAQDETTTVEVGTPFTEQFTNRGVDVYAEVPLIAGRRYGYDVREVSATGLYSYDSVRATLISPDGATEIDLGRATDAPTWAETRALTQGGTWTLHLDPERATTGSITAALVELEKVPGGTLKTGAVQTVEFTEPGQVVSLDLTGTPGRRPVLEFVSRDLAYGGGNNDVPALGVTLTRPDGTYARDYESRESYLEMETYDVAGTWSLALDPQWRATGSVTVRLVEVEDLHAALPLGRRGTVTSSVRWQDAFLTVDGAEGQALRFEVSDQSWSADGQGPGTGSIDLKFLRPDGSEAGYRVLYRPGVVEDTAVVFESPVFDVPGTWTVWVDPGGDSTGSLSGRVSLVQPAS
ncbi:hypothetical protein KIH74_10915 [Kineosporia sp. J2-2]|uniref:Uncharacterized protein n=1 Tax=Kineosporia corallincola TaxID=2835133 RepID=A0ABS5TF16_9ACTN|nr:hypothetical protein [Kineosporia corallincola]MBT0769433.1 hypothetical protein [Kineosporia corallincola]